MLGALGLLLQQVSVPYTATAFGRVQPGTSLVQLHVGWLLAIALLERDRRVLAGVILILFFGWIGRALAQSYDMASGLPFAATAYLLRWGWLLLCARWMGWPKPPGAIRVDMQDLAKFAGIGLLLFPLGSTAIASASAAIFFEESAETASSALQMLFATHFGVTIVAFPLVMAWCEWSTSSRGKVSRREWVWPLLLCLAVVGSIVATLRVHQMLGSLGGDSGVVLMDYRFTLFALLGWCVWRLRPRWSMPLLSFTLFGMVAALAGAATQSGTPLGFLNLAHLAIELNVLLMAMLYFLVFERDRRELTIAQAKQREEFARAELEKSRLDLDLALEGGQLGIWNSKWPSRASAVEQLEAEFDADANTYRICGIPNGQRVTQRAYLEEVIHPEDRDRVLANLMEVVACGYGTYADTYRIRRADGIRVHATLAALLTRWDASAGEEVRSITGIVRDITDEENLKEDLRHKAREAQLATEAKARFLAMMSHEIRTPMNGIVGMIELLAETPMGSTQQHMLKSCKDSAFALLTILNDILDFSKIEAGKIDLEIAPVSLRDIVEGVGETLSTYASQRGIALSVQVAPEVPGHVLSDEVRLRQILANLVSNAIKFTERGSVTLAVALAEKQGDERECIRFDVVDTGIGMDDKALHELFQPFRQADAATTRRFGGTGLGLSIVKQLVELMSGRVECESRLGQGSRFSVVIPMQVVEVGEGKCPAAGASAAPVAAFAAAADAFPLPAREREEAAGRLILLAEDNEVNREVISLQLARLGYACDMAEDGERAWTMLRSGVARYALVLTDCHMPHLDGYDLTRRIRDYERGAGAVPMPVVAITASALQGEGERCFEAGMSAYLAKPMQLHELQQCLVSFLPTISRETAEPTTDAGTPSFPLLRSIAGNDEGKFRSLLSLFESITREDGAHLEAAHLVGDRLRVQELAHKLKSGCWQVGEETAARALEAVELQALGDVDAAIYDRYVAIALGELRRLRERVAVYFAEAVS